MSEHKPWYKKQGFIIAIVLLVIVAILAVVYALDQNQAPSQSVAQPAPPPPPSQVAEQQISETAPYSEPVDSAAQDQEDESTVDFARLKAFIQKIQSRPVDTTNLDAAINQIISDNKDLTFGVSISYLNSGQTHTYGTTESMTAASVTKVLTAVDYYKQVEAGYRSLDTVMSNGYTAEYNIEQMIVVSNNDAWHVLNEDLTYEQLQAYAESIGLASYDYSDNTISASDVTQLLTDMYQRKLIGEVNTEQLLSYMERANYRDLVIPAVPETDTVYHKAGEYNGYLHDATIITNTKDTIVLTIFTRSLKGYNKAHVAELMQQITVPTLETFHLNE